jgi:homeobox protein SIX1
MLQHPASDFYDIPSATSLNTRQTPPSYSPTGAGATVGITNNNNNSNSNNNNNGVDMIGQNGNVNSGDRESLPSFGFTQEQVACVCEVGQCYLFYLSVVIRLNVILSIFHYKWKVNSTVKD